MLLLHLVQNIALLVSLSFLHGLFMRHYNLRPGLRTVISGILFGCVALVGMLLPVRWESGIIFDGRSIVLSIAGLFGGPVSASIAALMSAIYRLWLGGAGTTMGVSVIFESAMLGSIFYYLRRKYPDILTILNLYLFGLMVHLIMVMLMLTLPQANTTLAFQHIALPVLLVYPPAVVLVALLFIQNESIIKSEQRLRDSELKSRLFFEQAAVGIAEVAPDGRILNPNYHFCEILGYSRDELQKLNFRDITNPEDLHLDEKYIAEVMAGQRDSFDIEKRYIHKDGYPVWIHLYSNVIRNEKGDPLYAIASIIDITNRKQAEQDLQANYQATRNLLEDLTREIEERQLAEEHVRESEEKFRSLFSQHTLGIYIHDLEGRIIDVNPVGCLQLGYTKEELSGLTVFDFHPKNTETIDLPKDEIIQIWKSWSPGIKNTVNAEHQRKDGSIFPVEISTGPLFYGEAHYILSIVQDITERKQAEEQLKKNQYYLKKAQEIGLIGTWELDIQKNILIWTDENYKIFGVPPGTDINYGRFLECVHPDDRDYVNEQWEKGIKIKSYNIEHRLLVDGKIKWVREKAEIQYDDKDQPIKAIGFSQDITERKQDEEQLHEKIAMIERFNKVMVGREHKMIELKQEVNELCEKLGIPKKYRKE